MAIMRTSRFRDSPETVLAFSQCIVHRASCTSRGVSELQQLHSNLSEALRDRPFKLSAEAKRVFVAYQIEEDGAASDWGRDKNNAQIHAALDEL